MATLVVGSGALVSGLGATVVVGRGNRRDVGSSATEVVRPFAPGERASPLDQPFRAPATGRTFTFRALLAELRAQGVRPAAGSEKEDEALAAAFLPLGASRPAFATPEESVAPHPALGLAEGLFVRTRPVAGGTSSGFQDIARLQVGSQAQMLGETAAMKASRVRRCGQSETTWASVFPYREDEGDLHQYGLQYQKPSDLVASFEADGFARLGAVEDLFFAALVLARGPVRLDLTVFNGMAGMSLNYSDSRSAYLDTAIEVREGWPRTDGVTYRDVYDGKPAWQTGFLLPSGDGWDPFYWDPSQPGFGGVGGTASEQTYQMLATNVWPTRAAQPDASRYAKECARRKCLGLAAFAWELGKWLDGWDQVMRRLGLGTVYDLVDCLEVANEPDQYWELPSSAPTAAVAEAAVQEVGRYVALLAGPVRHWLPLMRFRVELMSWFDPSGRNVSTHDERTRFLARVLTDGLSAETDWWAEVDNARGRARPPQDVADWQQTEAQAGFQWPPTGHVATARGRLTPRDLVHEVGYHYYHGFNVVGNRAILGYLPARDTAREARAFVDRMSALTSVNLRTTVGEVGWPAIDPGRAPDRGYFVEDTSEQLQAAMFVRLALVLLASGIDHVKAFTFNYGFPPSYSSYPSANFTSWGVFYTNGVHNDVYWRHSSLSSTRAFLQATDCWPRPGWYAWRRLAWLLSLLDAGASPSANIRLVSNHQGFTVVELTFGLPVSTGPDGVALRQAWSRAYVLWLDQSCDDANYFSPPRTTNAVAHFQFDEEQQSRFPAELPGYELVSLVPSVTPPVYVASTNPRGYAAPSAVSWAWTGWNDALVSEANPLEYVRTDPSSSVRVPRWRLEIEIQKCAPDSGSAYGGVAVAPLCLFTHGTFTHAD